MKNYRSKAICCNTFACICSVTGDNQKVPFIFFFNLSGKKNFSNLFTGRMMEMLETVMSKPIFYQITIFAFQIAVCLFQIEHVSRIFPTFPTHFLPFPYFLSLFRQTSYSPPKNATEMDFNFVFSWDQFVFFSAQNYTLCFFITTITIVVVSTGDVAYDSHWYQMSKNDAYIIQMIIERSQKAFGLRALGVFVCSLETYAKVIIGFQDSFCCCCRSSIN